MPCHFISFSSLESGRVPSTGFQPTSPSPLAYSPPPAPPLQSSPPASPKGRVKKMWNCENFSLYIHLFQNIGELKKVWNYDQFAPPPPSVWKIPHTFFYPFPKYTLQFWPQFPLGRITPSEIENFIRDSSSNIHNDCQLSAVSAFILILSSFQGLVMWADSVSSNAKNIIILWECKINYKYLISSSQYQA